MTSQEPEKRKRSHDQEQPPRRAATRKRQATACEECRLRKRKCDGALPACEGCSRRMCECVYLSGVQAWEWHQKYCLNDLVATQHVLT